MIDNLLDRRLSEETLERTIPVQASIGPESIERQDKNRCIGWLRLMCYQRSTTSERTIC